MHLLASHEWQSLLQEHLSGSKRPLVCILGPTASGKTDFSLRVAEEIARTSNRHEWHGAEIVNADSRQLYRFLDIGTAKIRSEEMRGIPHHLIDVLDPDQEVTIAWYQERATSVIEDILARKAVPILVGGSMLYISAVIDGLQPVAAADPLLRKNLERAYDADGGASLHEKLSSIDPDSAQSIPRVNKRYLIRALEIWTLSGKPASQQKTKRASSLDLLLFGLFSPRPHIVQRINERTKKLLKNGWPEEVETLMKRGYGPHTPAMKSHGYKEIMERMMVEAGESEEELSGRIAARTRQYAKRQMTWWKQDPRIRWIDAKKL